MNWLAIALGGGLGAVARHAVGLGMAAWLGTSLPYGTFVANAVGSFLLGVVAVAADGHQLGGVDTRLALGTGLLGGFTTYSSFNYETLRMLETAAYGRAAGYVGLTWVVCLIAGAAGIAVAKAVKG